MCLHVYVKEIYNKKQKKMLKSEEVSGKKARLSWAWTLKHKWNETSREIIYVKKKEEENRTHKNIESENKIAFLV